MEIESADRFGLSMPNEPKRPLSPMAGFGEAMGLAAELVATTLVGAGLGWLLSRWLGFTLVFVLIGSFLGGAAGVNRVYRSWSRRT